MKNVFWVVLLAIFLSACAAPRYSGSLITDKDFDEVVIIKDLKTKIGFLQTIESWLDKHKYKYKVASDGSKHNLGKLTLEYVGYWKWDLALYLSNAEITAYLKGQRVGEVGYRAPNSLNMRKFGNAEERVGYMMDILFGELTAAEATSLINTPTSTVDPP